MQAQSADRRLFIARIGTAKKALLFLKKRNKKLFEKGSRALSPARAQINKVFFASFLFTKKKILPVLHYQRIAHSIF